MKKFFDKLILRFNNLDQISKNIKKISKITHVGKIFEVINSYSSESEVRYVGGCVRKVINAEDVNDIDLATNLEPYKVCEILEKYNIEFYKSGIEHGTVTAIINDHKFEITSLREDIFTDGRHAKVRFSQDWIKDAARRDFTFNSIYSDIDGNLFDPYNGKNDLENGIVNFIGDVDKRIKEDYLRILRYIRFFLNYSKHNHNLDIIRKIKINLDGVAKISKERLLDELKKISNLETLEKLSKDKLSFEIISIIFPELKNISLFSKLKSFQKEIIKKNDFNFLISLMVIDGTDNADYFLYKYNISKKEQTRIKLIDNFYIEKINSKTFAEENLNKIFYYYGKQTLIDILNFRLITIKKIDKNILELVELYKKKDKPVLPIGANILMSRYKIPEGRELGLKLKAIEQEWINNNFTISDQQIEKIVNN